MSVTSENRPPLTFRQIILMNFGFSGMQQTATNPIFSFLNADARSLPLLNMAGPITGDRLQRCRLPHPP
jgi:maltose/moltooligosaccharide transporter